MCLNKPNTSLYMKLKNTLDHGYKLFRKKDYDTLINCFHGCGITSQVYGIDGQYYLSYPEGMWLKSSNGLLKYDGVDEKYSKGFHFYPKYDDVCAAKIRYYFTLEVIRKVFVKKIVAVGNENGMVVAVAKEMFICPDDWDDEDDREIYTW